jgi:hypothetical protein
MHRHSGLQRREEDSCGFYFWFMTVTYLLTLALLFDLVFVTYAHAYIDPNAGGFFFQTVAPFIYGILGVIVVFWKRITGFVKGIISRKKDQDNPTQDE